MISEVAMLAVLYFLLFAHCGIVILFSLLPRKSLVGWGCAWGWC